MEEKDLSTMIKKTDKIKKKDCFANRIEILLNKLLSEDQTNELIFDFMIRNKIKIYDREVIQEKIILKRCEEYDNKCK